MELLPEADTVLRDLVPRVLESAGHDGPAVAMRRVGPVTCSASLARAAAELGRLRRAMARDHGVPRAVRDAMFWAEAAAWAAVRGDATSMWTHIRKMTSTVAEGSCRAVSH